MAVGCRYWGRCSSEAVGRQPWDKSVGRPLLREVVKNWEDFNSSLKW